MRTKGIDHYVLHVADAERSVAWYGEVLGLQPERLEEWREGKVPFVSLRVDATTIIDLLQARADRGEREPRRLRGRGRRPRRAGRRRARSDVDSGPADLFGAQGIGRGLYIRDPDGNLVELEDVLTWTSGTRRSRRSPA